MTEQIPTVDWKTISKRRCHYKDISEADMFERDVHNEYLELVKKVTARNSKYFRRPCHFGFLCENTNFGNNCSIRSEEDCWLMYARIRTEHIWKINGRGN